MHLYQYPMITNYLLTNVDFCSLYLFLLSFKGHITQMANCVILSLRNRDRSLFTLVSEFVSEILEQIIGIACSSAGMLQFEFEVKIMANTS